MLAGRERGRTRPQHVVETRRLAPSHLCDPPVTSGTLPIVQRMGGSEERTVMRYGALGGRKTGDFFHAQAYYATC
jgi:hypothetical protein